MGEPACYFREVPPRATRREVEVSTTTATPHCAVLAPSSLDTASFYDYIVVTFQTRCYDRSRRNIPRLARANHLQYEQHGPFIPLVLS